MRFVQEAWWCWLAFLQWVAIRICLGRFITRQEKTITGSYYGTANTARDFPLYADLYSKGKLDLDRLVSKTYSLDQINEAYADMLSGEVARGMIVF